MWFFEDYCESDDVKTSLYYCRGGKIDEQPSFTGLVEYGGTTNAFSISHKWGEKKNLFSTATEAFKELESGVRNLVGVGQNMIGMGKATETDFVARKPITKMSLLKDFQGTNIDFAIPKFSYYIITDSLKNKNIIKTKINELVGITNNDVNNQEQQTKKDNIKKLDVGKGNLKFAGEVEYDNESLVTFYQLPPSNFRFSYDTDINKPINGTFMMKNNKFKIENLVIKNVNVEYSDTVVFEKATETDFDKIAKIPIFAKVTLEFELARTPLLNDLSKFLNNK